MLKNGDIVELYGQYVLPTYRRYPLCLVKGRGSFVWDIEGKRYLDLFPGWAVSGLGHCHPEVVRAIKSQAKKIIHVPNHFLNVKQAQLAKAIVEASFPGRVFFCNSGAEANEGAIKFARKLGSTEGRFEIISMRQSFHGRTLGALSATGQPRVQSGFEPLVPGFHYAEFNNLASVERLIGPKTAAVLLEPILGEGGVQAATPEFMRGLRGLCSRHKLLLMLDEVQTGMGRTGRMFAFQHYEIEPDVMTLAKSLGSGVPLGAFVVHNQLAPETIMDAGTHGSTYGGNPLVAAAGLAVFKAIAKQRLVERSLEMGAYLRQRLGELQRKFPVMREIRGLGLMCGVELSTVGAPYVEAALAKGLLINCTQERVLRIMPPLTVSKRELALAVRILAEVFSEVQPS